MWHMFFSGTLAFACVRGGYVTSINMSSETYLRAIVPIGALFAGEPLFLTTAFCSSTFSQLPTVSPSVLVSPFLCIRGH